MRIVANAARSILLLHADEPVMILEKNLGEITRAGHHQFVADETGLLTFRPANFSLSIGCDMRRARPVAGLAGHLGVSVLGVQRDDVLVAIGTRFTADMPGFELPGLLDGIQPEVTPIPKGFGHHQSADDDGNHQDCSDDQKNARGMPIAGRFRLHESHHWLGPVSG